MPQVSHRVRSLRKRLPRFARIVLPPMTDLEQHVHGALLVDTHEHLNTEHQLVNDGPDILGCLFDHYSSHDLRAAGASRAAIDALYDRSNPDLRARFEGIRTAWEASQFTGYGEGVRWVARALFDIDELSADAIERAAPRALAMLTPGERHRILRDVARIDHVQIDDFNTAVSRDPDRPDFFRYDMSWARFARGALDRETQTLIGSETGVNVVDMRTLERGLRALFAKHAPGAVAIKTQHAYNRTLFWEPRTRDDAETALQKLLRGGSVQIQDTLCIGDWCLGLACELAAEHALPIKIHTGYYAGNEPMPMDRIHASQLSGLIAAYPNTRFVLMHTAYPYGGEVIALAKHYPNVYADLCWAWSIDPRSTEAFVRAYLHTAPANKLFIFGGDSFWPHAAAAYAWQARRGLTRVLSAEIADGFVSERQAIDLATRWMRGNAYACFPALGPEAAS
jgi:uncharacterized protein